MYGLLLKLLMVYDGNEELWKDAWVTEYDKIEIYNFWILSLIKCIDRCTPSVAWRRFGVWVWSLVEGDNEGQQFKKTLFVDQSDSRYIKQNSSYLGWQSLRRALESGDKVSLVAIMHVKCKIFVRHFFSFSPHRKTFSSLSPSSLLHS
jgi:hypothetical protein